jgi:hypothetical protein
LLLQSGPMLHDVKVKVKNVKGRVKIEPCPPEEILVAPDERNIDPNTMRFFEHRQWKTISDLREMGYGVEDDIADDPTTLFMSEDWLSRQEFAEEETWRDEPTDGVMRRVVYREAYIKVDFDGDGIAERRMVCMVGKTILSNEACDGVPFAAITPYVMPHRHIGRALADYVKDIQVIKSVILRNVLDNFYASNNSRTAVSDKVNLDDLLTTRPAGVVRVDGVPAEHIMQMQINAIGPAAFPLMEYLDSNKENRTGITRYNQGMDANTLNKTASGIQQIMSAAQAKQELIARTLAETGVKQLFQLVHKLIRQHGNKQEVVRLRNKWVPIDPRQWKNRTDMTVSVGLGTGNKQEMLVQIMQILGVQQQALAIGVCTPQNIYEACVELTKNAGFKDGDKYWTNPQQQQQQPPAPDPKVVEAQMKAKLESEKLAQADKHHTEDLQAEASKQAQDFFLGMQELMVKQQTEADKRMADMAKLVEEVRMENQKLIKGFYDTNAKIGQTAIDGGMNT